MIDRRRLAAALAVAGVIGAIAAPPAWTAEGVAPSNVTAPSVSGVARDGETLTVEPGAWTGTEPIGFGYQWRRCDAGGCAAIAGATASSYRLSGADVGSTIEVEEAASNDWGSSSATSPPTAVVEGVAPSNVTAPSVSGVARDGETLTVEPGAWTGTEPIGFGYQWRRCTLNGTPCVAIDGAIASTYALSSIDVGSTIRVAVTATNSAGTQSADSSATTAVAALPAAPGDPVLAAAGDIACDPASTYFNGGLGKSGNCRQKYTSDLLMGAGLTAVLPLGDEQYECGGYSAFLGSYDLSWGRLRAISRPAAGDEEYATSGGTGCDATGKASGYFDYFGTAAGAPGKGWYSYDIAAWHIVVLNSNCSKVGGCGAGSAQEKWLKADLALHPSRCTLAYWHHPRFSSNGNSTAVQALWQDLAAAGADVLLTGHRHNYERFAPQDPSGAYEPVGGIREFVVGTGGKSHQSLPTTASPNSEVRNAKTYGILALTLHGTSYDWQFVPEAKATFRDSGSTFCH